MAKEYEDQEIAQEDIDAVLNMLENFGKSQESRLKVVMSEQVEEGKTKKQYHYGRCDVGSPWAKGQAFDVIEDGREPGVIEDVTDLTGKSMRNAGDCGCE